ncbi:MAG: AAA family ATPase, partial [Ktedonobacteraceae bacterium]
MLITGLELENIKSYKSITVNFQRGTTAISGSNGAGKTTLVEAIGFALFDSMPYRQDQFVREGEKYGKVVVHLIGNDNRPYEVERRCGSGAAWLLHDREANLRLEQRADVQDKLHELFGIERERSLENLFRDALGVPQGAFTAIFLQAPRARKQTFDALLQIEDYSTAATYLLEAQKQYKEQGTTQDREIQRLTFETRELGNWQATLKAAREQDQELKTRNVASTHRLSTQQAYFEQLKQRHIQRQQYEAKLGQRKLLYANAQQQ